MSNSGFEILQILMFWMLIRYLVGPTMTVPVTIFFVLTLTDPRFYAIYTNEWVFSLVCGYFTLLLLDPVLDAFVLCLNIIKKCPYILVPVTIFFVLALTDPRFYVIYTDEWVFALVYGYFILLLLASALDAFVLCLNTIKKGLDTLVLWRKAIKKRLDTLVLWLKAIKKYLSNKKK